MAKILVVEDEAPTAAMIKDCLETNRHTVDVVHEGITGLRYLEEAHYDLVILDYNLPNLSGIDICRQFRMNGGKLPVLFLTGRSEISDKAEGFNAGADDYLSKPFHPEELLLRVRALLRRPVQEFTQTITCGNLVIDPGSKLVRKNGIELNLRNREYGLLEFLARHQDTYFTSQALLERVWETDSEATEIALRSCISRLRRKIDEPGRDSFIQSERRLGYRMPKQA